MSPADIATYQFCNMQQGEGHIHTHCVRGVDYRVGTWVVNFEDETKLSFLVRYFEIDGVSRFNSCS